MNDNVNHPSHYTSGKIEVIDFIEDQGFGFHIANAVKYLSRAGKKNPDKIVEDFEKAIWYINRRIGQLKEARVEGKVAMDSIEKSSGPLEEYAKGFREVECGPAKKPFPYPLEAIESRRKSIAKSEQNTTFGDT